jgi:hypothetical protein
MPGASSIHTIPTPLDTDPVADGAETIRDIVSRLETLLPRSFRTGPHAVAAVDTSYAVAVVFPDAYPVGTVPVVQVTAEVGAPTAIVTVSGITHTGFTLNYRRVSGTVSVSAMVTTQVLT